MVRGLPLTDMVITENVTACSNIGSQNLQEYRVGVSQHSHFFPKEIKTSDLQAFFFQKCHFKSSFINFNLTLLKQLIAIKNGFESSEGLFEESILNIKYWILNIDRFNM